MQLPTEGTIRPIVMATLGPRPLPSQDVFAAVKQALNLDLSDPDEDDRMWLRTKAVLWELVGDGLVETLSDPAAVRAAGGTTDQAGPLEAWFRVPQ